jgi:hypothetical protein
MTPWQFDWSWLVVTVTGDGTERVQWRCETRHQANRERDAIQDRIMNGTTDVASAWVTHSDTYKRG